ncbi:restriction endonuclease subunit S [Turicibacter sanguinis]|uniref:restriction endonuclease subunit S n=1 Tax=Turicibacter sanguinis TaxID=154288 RepID=UPI00325BB95F
MTNVPNLRFKGFTSNYKKTQFSDCVSIRNGQVDPCVEPYCDMLHIGPGNMEKFTGRLLAVRTAKEDSQTSGKYLFDENDVLYGKINPQFGKVVFPKYKGLCSADTYPLKGSKMMISPYLFYSLQTGRFLKYSISVSMRTGMPKINREELNLYNFNLPSIEEQEKIASFFSLIDKKIELQTEKVEELKNYKKGIMQKIFSQELRFKDEDGNEYPEWEKRRLQTIVEKKIKGKNPLYSETGNVLLNNEFMENNTEPLFVENEIDVTKKDILILWDGSQAGKVYTGFEGVLGSTFVAITLNKNNCNIFIQEQLEYNLNKIQRAWREGSGVPHVAKDFIENYKIFVPCYEEQSKISKMLLNINEKIKLEEKKLQYIKELKKGLLQQMFI